VKNRPKNLNLFTIHFPIPAIVSILHRVSGVLLFFMIPLLLWGLYLSLRSEQDFDMVHAFITISTLMKLIIWGFLAAFIYHFIAGIRHLLMDMHIGEDLKGGRIASFITIVLSVILITLLGIWIW